MPDESIDTPQNSTGGDDGIGSGDSGGNDFISSLPESVRSNEHLRSFSDAGALAQAYVDARSKVPTVPGSPDDYQITKLEGVGELDQEGLKNFRGVAHRIGLTQEQVSELTKYDQQRFIGARQKANEKREQARIEAENTMRQEFGEQYDAKLKTATQVLQTFADDDFVKFLERTQLGNRPEMVRFMLSVAEKISEDLLHEGRPAVNTQKRPVAPDGSPRLKFGSMGDK